MASYDFTSDDELIFTKGYIQDNQANVITNASGDITHGCYLASEADDISHINSSWATVSTLSGFQYAILPSSNVTPNLNLAANLVNCGISPILNATLLNVTAHENLEPYNNFSYSAIWSWAVREPKNYSLGPDDSQLRCATNSLDLSGRWIVSSCKKYHVACRATGQPYNWTVTDSLVSYSDTSKACSDPYVFAAPRTALENSFLAQVMRDSGYNLGGTSVLIDLNSLDVRGCWVTGGANATCPYIAVVDPQRIILVPTIAAIIVLVVMALTLFVKIAGNHKTRKRKRRRSGDGFVYEGVPS
jgi:hypothetical protein